LAGRPKNSGRPILPNLTNPHPHPLHSAEELAARLADPAFTVVVSLSRQSVASLGAAGGLTPRQTTGKLSAFLRGMGVAAVLDSGSGRDLALMEAAAEFLTRYRAAHGFPSGESSSVDMYQFGGPAIEASPSATVSVNSDISHHKCV